MIKNQPHKRKVIIMRTYILLTFFFSSMLQAAPVIHETYADYQITGHSVDALRAQMSMLGPMDVADKHFDASTKWAVNWQYRYQMVDHVCYFTKVNVKVDVTYHFPEWSDYLSGSEALQYHWDNYMQHLMTHEKGHAGHGILAATTIDNTLRRLPPMQSCEDLSRTADHIAYQIIAEYNTIDVMYENATNHGATQGATFP